MSNWNPIEEKKLVELVGESKDPDWYVIARNFTDKNWRACRSKYWKLQNNYKYKDKRDEDEEDRKGAYWSDTEIGTVVSLMASKKPAKAIAQIMNRDLKSTEKKMKQIQKQKKHGFGL